MHIASYAKSTVADRRGVYTMSSHGCSPTSWGRDCVDPAAGKRDVNNAPDHIQVVDEALAQIPTEYRNGAPILVRADGGEA